jgi:hypothetical protein
MSMMPMSPAMMMSMNSPMMTPTDPTMTSMSPPVTTTSPPATRTAIPTVLMPAAPQVINLLPVMPSLPVMMPTVRMAKPTPLPAPVATSSALVRVGMAEMAPGVTPAPARAPVAVHPSARAHQAQAASAPSVLHGAAHGRVERHAAERQDAARK